MAGAGIITSQYTAYATGSKNGLGCNPGITITCAAGPLEDAAPKVLDVPAPAIDGADGHADPAAAASILRFYGWRVTGEWSTDADGQAWAPVAPADVAGPSGEAFALADCEARAVTRAKSLASSQSDYVLAFGLAAGLLEAVVLVIRRAAAARGYTVSAADEARIEQAYSLAACPSAADVRGWMAANRTQYTIEPGNEWAVGYGALSSLLLGATYVVDAIIRW